ncbi:hypothetical protein [Thiothrix subterranea]|uniref:hypothetical protein n=1 Tax=Thiothrix subterranea TaxID=2735563 RepID=UPI00280AFD8B|nr:hypothetical protein [Thiothrix subterranea]
MQKQVLDQLRIETYDQVLKLQTLYGERDAHPNDEKLARDFHSTLGELYALRQATLQGVEVAKDSRIIAGIQAEQVEDSNSHFAPHPIKWRKLDLSH